MAESIAVTCPECSKTMSVPATLAGKKVRCKGCEAVVPVPAPKAKATFQLADEPKPKTKPKPATKIAKPAPAPAAAKPKEEELDEDGNPYDVTAHEADATRCPFCALALDPPDARICSNCGYDMQERKRRGSKSVYQHTFGDYIVHHGITILAVLFIIGLIVLNIFTLQNMDEWFEKSFLELDEKDATTGKPKYIVNPGFGKLYVGVASLGLAYYAGRFIFKMLRHQLHPQERHVV